MSNKNTLRKFKSEYIGRVFAYCCGIFLVVVTFAIIFFLVSKGIQTFTTNHYNVFEFIFGTTWDPQGSTPSYGALIFIVGSTCAAAGAVIISAPIAIALAVFINMISPKFGKKVLQPALEIFVGIPSVVYGWIGITVLVPHIRLIFGGTGFSVLAAILVLSIMILPTIATIATDSIKALPKDYMEASYGLGATRWQTIYKVIVPAAKNGILTGVVLGLGRAFGEALAVQMVIGNTLKMASSLLSPTTTLTSILTSDIANTSFGSMWNNALWSLALILLVISFIFIIIIRIIGRRGN